MPVESAQTTSKLDGPRVKQFSVFLKNKVGALLDIVKLLNEHNIHVLALNVQDSADSAIVRIVVSDPERVQDLFGIHDIPYSLTEFVVVEMKQGATDSAGSSPRSSWPKSTSTAATPSSHARAETPRSHSMSRITIARAPSSAATAFGC